MEKARVKTKEEGMQREAEGREGNLGEGKVRIRESGNRNHCGEWMPRV